MRDTERGRDIGRGRSRLHPCREPDAGLHPGTPGSCPEPKADAQRLSYPGVPVLAGFFSWVFNQTQTYPILQSLQNPHILFPTIVWSFSSLQLHFSEFQWFHFLNDHLLLGLLGYSAVEHLPSAQGMILESRDGVPRWAPCMEPASPSACISAPLSLSLSLKNK